MTLASFEFEMGFGCRCHRVTTSRLRIFYLIFYGILGLMSGCVLFYLVGAVSEVGPSSERQRFGYGILILTSGLAAFSAPLILFAIKSKFNSAIFFLTTETFLFLLIFLSLAGSICFVDQPTPNSVHRFAFQQNTQKPPLFLNFLQSHAGCCGVHGYADYENGSYPQSCCVNPEQDCMQAPSGEIHSHGCLSGGFQKLLERLRKGSGTRLKLWAILFVPHLHFMLVMIQTIVFNAAFFFIVLPGNDGLTGEVSEEMLLVRRSSQTEMNVVHERRTSGGAGVTQNDTLPPDQGEQPITHAYSQ